MCPLSNTPASAAWELPNPDPMMVKVKSDAERKKTNLKLG